MNILTFAEIEQVGGAGKVKEIVDDVKSADFKGAYDNVVDAVSHMIERVAGVFK